jgi:hypothetical protein
MSSNYIVFTAEMWSLTRKEDSLLAVIAFGFVELLSGWR